MKNLKTLFIRWYFNEFVNLDPLHLEMSKVSENSPYHREINVGTHTNMVVAEYISLANSTWEMADLIGALTCVFHDVGKPTAKTEAYKPERGTYYKYNGHEVISARLWEDWAVRNWSFLQTYFEVEIEVIYGVGWLIENHLPYAIKKTEKRQQIAMGVADILYAENYNAATDVYFNILIADTWGRISDDHVEKKASVNTWCTEFEMFFNQTILENKQSAQNENAPILYLPIGVSGSGKSTFYNNKDINAILNDNEYFSMNTLRLEWYDKNDYSNAFKLSCDDKDFNNKVASEFSKLLKNGKSIYVDNMNISKKGRAKYINKARDHGYYIIAILFPVTLQTILDRQKTRTDKTIPVDVVNKMYMSLSLPSRGEVDSIIAYIGNI